MPASKKPPERLRRRNAPEQWTVLPAGGTTGPAPTWPIGKASAEEVTLWKRLWALPVASWWREQAIEPTIVARYVRMIVENPKLTAAGRLEEALGLTPLGMVRLRLTVEQPEVAKAERDPYAAAKRKRGYA